jgi:signal transduction histidine kinase
MEGLDPVLQPLEATGLRRRVQWLPIREGAVVDQFGLHGRPERFLLSLGALFAVFALPPIANATGASPSALFLTWLFLAVSLMTVHHWCYRRARTSNAAFYTLLFANIGAGAFVCLVLPVLSHAPQTPLWMAFCMMACINGASESESSAILGIFHFTAPLLTIPFFVAQGAPYPWAVVGPITCALGSGYGYQFLARRGHLWRLERHEKEMRDANRRLEESERERTRLARDLHDSVGTALSLVTIYTSLVEQRLGDPTQARQLMNTVREAANAGLDELRGLLHALPGESSTLDQFANGLAVLGSRMTAGLGIEFSLALEGDTTCTLEAPIRVALVRIFQEALHNGVRHGGAKGIAIHLTTTAAGTIVLEVSDNGRGFDVQGGRVGKGLPGMHERARELGGSVAFESSPLRGTRVRVELPLRSRGAK